MAGHRKVLVTSVAIAVLVISSLPAMAPPTLARLTSTRTSIGSLATGTLLPPTALSGTGGLSVSLGWTASTSTGAAGYSVLRSATNGSGYTQVKTVTPVSAASTTDTPHVGTWYYVLQTFLQGWTSASSNQATVVVAAGSTGAKSCTTTAAVTTGSGDNNGFETNPGNACALDAAVATDASSGTTTTNSCTNSGKDRHQLWGYAFGLPSSPTSVDGITVTLRASVNSTTSTPTMCVDLSWDGGTTWTTAQQTGTLTTALATYTLGGVANKWGRTSWAAADLGTTLFRVRVTDVASSTARTFSLDAVQVAVNYTP